MLHLWMKRIRFELLSICNVLIRDGLLAPLLTSDGSPLTSSTAPVRSLLRHALQVSTPHPLPARPAQKLRVRLPAPFFVCVALPAVPFFDS